ncbi:MAG: DUF2115 domain-containing protein [Methanobrevibacter sp.]|uniref:DUF2115 family protein n=1 Tax=Methanobrevibacter sp. TaxID=66852 RepID=UPI0025CBF67F|nr:DUF2115 family protein [Methanobrevibacter sp.]MBQ8018148.1 DUF2115 domain-containing protein [Methanobrevibacter sp.]
MADEYLEMYDELSNLITDNNPITGNCVLEILKKYSSTISVFDMMEFTSHVMEENKYVQESYREEGQKSYIESFLLRIKDIMNDNNDYGEKIDQDPFGDAVETLKNHYQTGIHNSKPKPLLIFEIASIYSTFILKEPIHKVGTVFPGSLKVEKENDKFLCPVKDANIDTPNAVCNICLAEQLDF